MTPKTKAAKVRRFPWYWTYPNKIPVPVTMILNRDQVVRDGAGPKGKVIATLKKDSIVTMDTKEHDLSWTRNIRVKGENPVPQPWINAQLDKPEEDREGWLDDTALSPYTEPVVTPTGRTKWIITATIEQVEE